MKKWLVIGLAALLLQCGCKSSYVMKLNNGVQLTTATKPKLKQGYYYYKDARGREVAIPQGRVHQIMPASDAAEENKFTPSQPQKKHWYWPF